jgi:hypothetical protein
VGRLQASLREFDRLGAMFLAWPTGLFAEQNASIAAAEESERLAKQGTGHVRRGLSAPPQLGAG